VPRLGVTAGHEVGGTGAPLRFTIDHGERYTLWVVNVGLACCAVEFVAASLRAAGGGAEGIGLAGGAEDDTVGGGAPGRDAVGGGAPGGDAVEGSAVMRNADGDGVVESCGAEWNGDAQAPRVDVLVISGTVTDALAPEISRLYHERTPRPYVLSFGACANSGGPYWDSYVVTKGIDQILPVDIYVPGCPPRPEALLDGLARLARLARLGPSAASDPVRASPGPQVRAGHTRGARP
jgi:NADH-quinone oxidoreductase subunit B